MTFDYAARVERLQATMVNAGVDVVLLSVGADLPYFTGYEAIPSERLTVLVVAGSATPVLFVPELEAPRVAEGPFELVAWGESEDPVALTAERSDPSRIAVGDHMWSVFLTHFQREWTGAEWLPASELTRELRVRKDEAEIALLRSAAEDVDRVMARIPNEVPFAGRTEAEVARDLARLTIEEGHDVSDFTIVASGPNGASPHHHPGDRVINKKDIVVCDFGGRKSGYYSDSTRTFSVGDPTSEQVEVHRIVAEANAAARNAVSPGFPAQRSIGLLEPSSTKPATGNTSSIAPVTGSASRCMSTHTWSKGTSNASSRV
jgi:Xaa-Pro aminopeptidase